MRSDTGSTALLRNRAGYFVEPNTTTIMAAGEYAVHSGLIPLDPRGDYSRELEAIEYAGGKLSYPITCFTHIFIWTRYPGEKAEAIKEFLSWLAGPGSHYVIPGYAPLPGALRKIIALAAEIVGEG